MPLLPNLPKTIYKTESPISGKIRVVQVGKERRLVVGGLIQSINADAPDVQKRIWGQLVQIKNSTPKENKFPTGQEFEVQNALILGLGGGTVAHLLTQKFGLIQIDGVEIDPAIAATGKRYFGLDKLKNLNIVIGDAVSLVSNGQLRPWYDGATVRRGSWRPAAKRRQHRQRYDLIIVDLYCGENYPPGAESDLFFAGLKAILHPSGAVLFNRVSTKDDARFEEKLQKHFGGFKKTLVPSKFGGVNLIYTIKT